MVFVNRGTEKTEITLNGELGVLLTESVSLVESLRNHIIENVENPEEVIFAYVNELIDAAWGK